MIGRSGRRALGLVGLCCVGLCAVGLFAACSNLPTRANAENPVWKRRPGGALAVAYTRDLVANSRAHGEPYERGQPGLDLRGRRVFVGSSDGALYALSAPLGEVLWRFETMSYVQCRPLYDGSEDVVYFGSHDGALYKVGARDGKLHWRLSTRAEIGREPVLGGDLLYFANANDTLIAAERKTGKIAWTHHRSPAAGMEVAGYSGPLLAFGRAYMGFSDGTATAFDPTTGEEKWQPVDLATEAEETLGEPPKYLDVDTTPIAIDEADIDLVVFGSYAGGVYGLDAELGTLIWANPEVRGVSDIALYEQPAYRRDGLVRPARRLILVSTGVSGFWALDPKTGREVWRREVPRGGVSAPAFVDGAVLVNSSQLGTFLVSPVDGSLIDGIHFDLGVSGSPAGHGRRAFVMTNGGTLLALDVSVPASYREPPHYGAAEPFPVVPRTVSGAR